MPLFRRLVPTPAYTRLSERELLNYPLSARSDLYSRLCLAAEGYRRPWRRVPRTFIQISRDRGTKASLLGMARDVPLAVARRSVAAAPRTNRRLFADVDRTSRRLFAERRPRVAREQ